MAEETSTSQQQAAAAEWHGVGGGDKI